MKEHETFEAIKQKWLASVHDITSGADLAAYWWLSFMQTIRERIEQLHSDCKEALEPKQWRSLIRRAYFTKSRRLAKDFKDYKTGTFEDKGKQLGATEKQSEFFVWWKSSRAAEKTIVPLWVTTSTEKQSD